MTTKEFLEWKPDNLKKSKYSEIDETLWEDFLLNCDVIDLEDLNL